MARKTILIALGGNAIKKADEKGSAEEQFASVYVTCRELIKLLKAGHRLVITHGNGPQVGNILLQFESCKEIPAQPLDIAGSMTQGQIGYMFEQALTNLLWQEKMPLPVVAIVNQVLVSEDDPDYKDPTKPVGPFYTKEEAEVLKKERPDWVIKEVKPQNVERRFRRVVASPDPIRNMEYIAIRRMVEAGIVVIASGGGGIPVVYDKKTDLLKGTAAVIDKDLAGERLAEVVGADIFLVLTDVPNAMLNFGKPDQKAVERISCTEMQKLYNEGHFKAGSMGPKVKAALRFIDFGGDRSIITSLDKAFDAVRYGIGTQILPDWKSH